MLMYQKHLHHPHLQSHPLRYYPIRLNLNLNLPLVNQLSVQLKDINCKKFVFDGVVYYRDSEDRIWYPEEIINKKKVCKLIGKYCQYTDTIIEEKEEEEGEEEDYDEKEYKYC